MDLKDPIPQETRQRIEAREAEILGKPTRLPNVDRQAIAEEVIEVTTALRADLFPGAPALSFEEVPEIMFTMQPYLTIWSKIMAMSMQLLGPNARLSRRDQKLAILRTGWLLGAPFEFGEHAKQARQLGFTGEEIDRIVEQGSASSHWTVHEAAVLRTAEELQTDAMVSDATWDRLDLDHEQKFELVVLIGQFTTIAYFQNALRVKLEDGSKGLAAR